MYVLILICDLSSFRIFIGIQLFYNVVFLLYQE